MLEAKTPLIAKVQFRTDSSSMGPGMSKGATARSRQQVNLELKIKRKRLKIFVRQVCIIF